MERTVGGMMAEGGNLADLRTLNPLIMDAMLYMREPAEVAGQLAEDYILGESLNLTGDPLAKANREYLRLNNI